MHCTKLTLRSWSGSDFYAPWVKLQNRLCLTFALTWLTLTSFTWHWSSGSSTAQTARPVRLAVAFLSYSEMTESSELKEADLIELVTVNKRLLPETSTSASLPAKRMKKATETKIDVRAEKKESHKRLLEVLRDGQEVARTKWQQEKFDPFV